ncbi:hypothetical protein M2338_002933 [Sphingobium sp. B2D3B]|uniref:hypothetical protein n=1 Tax=Sphingobium sp. B2D3B TaxID=2940580 RepID=UPI00222596D9|nr:hypothetical protein [Sphingobium sp. B2D3B]MCW2383368.1 hypothetical protein [Sphingobium sp. B2D3B]
MASNSYTPCNSARQSETLRAAPFCERACPNCTIRCATIIAVRNDLLAQLARAEAALLDVQPFHRPLMH